MYTITLSDGQALEQLELNGNNFIAEGVIDEDVFDGNLGSVTISDGESAQTFSDLRLMSCLVRDGRTWIVLGEKSAQEKRDEETEQRLAQMEAAFAAMMGGIADA